MKHLVTGGSGFLGNLVVEKLIATGEQVVSLDIWDCPGQSKEVEFVKGDVLDRDLVKRLMKGVDIVHHMAALVPLEKAGKKFHQVNVEGTAVVAAEAANAGVRYFVHTSSSTVFGKPKCPITNDSPMNPLEDYGISKLGAERVVKEIADKNQMPLIVVRPRTMLGTGRLGIFQILFDWIRDGRNIYVIGDGTNRIQFLHADDLIDSYMFLCDKQQPGFYNVGTDRFGTLEETLNALIKHAGTRTKVKHLPKDLTISTLRTLDQLKLSPLAPWHYLTYSEDFYFDITPLLELGWKPKYSNDEMMIQSYDHFNNHHDQFKDANDGPAHRKKVKEKVLWVLKQLS